MRIDTITILFIIQSLKELKELKRHLDIDVSQEQVQAYDKAMRLLGSDDTWNKR